MNLDKLLNDFQKDLSKTKKSDGLEELRIKYLGRKKGILTKITATIPSLTADERGGVGTKVRKARDRIERLLEEAIRRDKDSREEKIYDVTIFGNKVDHGRLHPISLVIEDIKEIFHYLGFVWTDGPEVESDFYNFQMLNIPPNHPARDTQQTYYIDENTVLRTHTSNMQIRFLKQHKPPIRALFPGRVYRRDMPDATHLPSFYQLEGLLVDKHASMTDLLGVLDFFAKRFFGQQTKVRVYGHHFPYTEPSIEVEVLHPKKGWIEIMGAGMVHPNVLKNVGVDPRKYRGWAFGMGPDRLVMLRYGIEDLRILYSSSNNFLDQF
ncbi:MAG: phenylalanine--tRNA ligase subunit alpha [Candidatus Woykebacteria bacterium]